jgi:maleate isomerase
MTSPTKPSLTSPLDYARLGRLGIGTPQANPTVEAEIRRLLPFEVDTVTLRLTSDSADAATRLKSYLVNLPQHAKQFAGMPIDVFLFACTATSYLLETPLQSKAIAEAESVLGAPVITAPDALVSELNALGAQRIALVSPYPRAIMEAAVAWWTGKAFRLLSRVALTFTPTTPSKFMVCNRLMHGNLCKPLILAMLKPLFCLEPACQAWP